MRIWKVPDQLIRLAILLALAITATVVARHRFIPASFGETGHYRADAVTAITDQQIRYAGWKPCAECHDAESELKMSSYHRTLSCEVCHGPAFAHSEDYESQMPVVDRAGRSGCLYCHGYLPSRPTGFPQIIERLHNALEPCIDCHDPHDPTPPEIPSSCSACHAQIARTKAVSHHHLLSCETCHETSPEHLQKPRSALPRKPTDRAFCGQCHSAATRIDSRVPQVDLETHGETYLCWQCHYPHA